METSIGGPGGPFPSTLWTEILGARDPGDPARHQHLERLFRAYWRPVYAYVRASWRKSVEDAKDLTQAFFAHFIEKGYLTRLDPQQGSFRGYLKQALKHFLIDTERAASARRPAGGLFSLDARPEELQGIGPVSPEESPERAYDREWFHDLQDGIE